LYFLELPIDFLGNIGYYRINVKFDRSVGVSHLIKVFGTIEFENIYKKNGSISWKIQGYIFVCAKFDQVFTFEIHHFALLSTFLQFVMRFRNASYFKQSHI